MRRLVVLAALIVPVAAWRLRPGPVEVHDWPGRSADLGTARVTVEEVDRVPGRVLVLLRLDGATDVPANWSPRLSGRPLALLSWPRQPGGNQCLVRLHFTSVPDGAAWLDLPRASGWVRFRLP